uniref:Uncharacterized protein n=1 Tax=Anguilla anguilla TaxID=7936 RepID=A0A0E9WHB5_ANGAN
MLVKKMLCFIKYKIQPIATAKLWQGFILRSGFDQLQIPNFGNCG